MWCGSCSCEVAHFRVFSLGQCRDCATGLRTLGQMNTIALIICSADVNMTVSIKYVYEKRFEQGLPTAFWATFSCSETSLNSWDCRLLAYPRRQITFSSFLSDRLLSGQNLVFFLNCESVHFRTGSGHYWVHWPKTQNGVIKQITDRCFSDGYSPFRLMLRYFTGQLAYIMMVWFQVQEERTTQKYTSLLGDPCVEPRGASSVEGGVEPNPPPPTDLPSLGARMRLANV